MSDLITRLQLAYDKCKAFPEKDPAGMMALLELRNMVPEVITQLQAAAMVRPNR